MKRETWSHQAEYILSLLGYGIGVGSIWKFPYMCARNGGGSYLIPYLLFVLVGGVPLMYLEMFMGQYSQGNPISVWDVCPLFKGLGGGAGLLSSLFAIYYSTFFAWILYFLFYSFFPQLPWTQCGQPWNSPDCVEDFSALNMTLHYNDSWTSSMTGLNESVNLSLNTSVRNRSAGIPASEEFFRNNVLEITDGLENLGSLRWPLSMCLALTYLTVYICIIKGIRISGKVVYVTVLCPYILVTVILIRACTLPGSLDGILFYITPDFKKLSNFNIWMEACSFALYAPGITYGIIIKMAAHNPLRNNCLRDSFLVNIVCAFSQVYFGFSVFAMTGHLAHERGVTMDSYKTSGFKLGFITYPEATSFLPVPQLWSVMLFLMLFTLGIDSLIPSFEVVTSILGHLSPSLNRRRWLLNAVVMLPYFFLSLPYTTQVLDPASPTPSLFPGAKHDINHVTGAYVKYQTLQYQQDQARRGGGVYLLTLVEWFAFFPSMILFAIVMCIAVPWIYGISRISQIMKVMWGTGVPRVMEIFWKYICPLILLVIFGYSLYSYRPPVFEEYVYPWWANMIGWFISAMVVLPLPVYFVWAWVKADGNTLKEKLMKATQPVGKWKEDKLAAEELTVKT